MERKLKHQQLSVCDHKKHILNFLTDNRVVLAATLVPAVIWGWKQAREKSKIKLIKKIVRFGLLSVFTRLRQYIIYRGSSLNLARAR